VGLYLYKRRSFVKMRNPPPNLRLTPGRALGQPAPPGPRVAPPAAWRLYPRVCVGTRTRAAWHRVGRPTTAASAPAPAAPRARRPAQPAVATHRRALVPAFAGDLGPPEGRREGPYAATAIG
jgi:hypothetical protein